MCKYSYILSNNIRSAVNIIIFKNLKTEEHMKPDSKDIHVCLRLQTINRRYTCMRTEVIIKKSELH